ncbi:MAG TPA: hypothetical protein VG253_19905 [Streptosporangiaceae bacterium]|nr:hypothetical protein [Streptosporangiaceae bacterium]
MAVTGYSGTPLPTKLGIRPGDEVAFLNAPAEFSAAMAELRGVTVHAGLPPGEQLDVIVAFVTWRAELEAGLADMREHMAPACGLWIAWPKKAARLPTDMTDHAVRDVALPTGLVDNKVCAIDPTWTGLRLVIRRELR